jgi:A/G-specific adenine glycosylase
MLQQTRAVAVIPYYENFLHELPTVHDLAYCDDDRLMKLWQGLGYYSRARNLKKAAQVIVEQYGGKLPADDKTLRTLPGIGDYTAGAIASIAFGLPTPAVDGNVLRTVTRLLAWPADVLAASTKRAAFELLAPHYPAGHEAGALNQAFMDLGSLICLPGDKPQCEGCPVRRVCLAAARGTASVLPVRIKKTGKRRELRTVFIFRSGEKIAVRKRKNEGLLAGLYEFPNTEGRLTKEEAALYAENLGFSADAVKALPAARHVFSHVTWEMTGYEIRVLGDAEGFIFAEPKRIEEQYPIPSAFAAYAKACNIRVGAGKNKGEKA